MFTATIFLGFLALFCIEASHSDACKDFLREALLKVSKNV
jgi:hypothetical protein